MKHEHLTTVVSTKVYEYADNLVREWIISLKSLCAVRG